MRPCCEHNLRSDELVGGEPVFATEDSEPAAERQPGDPDRWAGAGGNRQAVRVELLVDVAEQCPGFDRDEAVGDRDRTHLAEVDQDSGSRGAAGEAVPAAPHRDLRSDPPCESDRLGNVVCRDALHHRLWGDFLELRPRGFT
jgi:hypothetical protein